jgi:hypothetical protein
MGIRRLKLSTFIRLSGILEFVLSYGNVKAWSVGKSVILWLPKHPGNLEDFKADEPIELNSVRIFKGSIPIRMKKWFLGVTTNLDMELLFTGDITCWKKIEEG